MVSIADERRRFADEGLVVVTRETTGLIGDYSTPRPVDEPADYLFVHITVTPDPIDLPKNEMAAWRTVERIGIARFGAHVGCSYNTGAMQSGRLYEGQPIGRRGAHTVNDFDVPGFPHNLNVYGRAIALCQNVLDEVDDDQVDAVAQWAAAMRRTKMAVPRATLHPHRQFTAKSCPGDKMMKRWSELVRLADHYTTVGLPGTPRPPTPPNPGDAMTLTAKDLEAIGVVVESKIPKPRILSFQSSTVPGVHTYKVEDNIGVHLTQDELVLARKLGITEGAGFLGGTPTNPLGDDFIGSTALLDGPLKNIG